MPRPTKYSDEKAAAIVRALSQGVSRAASAECVGIDYSTFTRWLKSFAEFCNAVTQAEAQCEAEYSEVMKKAAGGFQSGHKSRTVKTIFKTRKIKHPDGTTVEEPVALEEVTETEYTAEEFDWRAAESWLKRRRKTDWGDSQEITGNPDKPLFVKIISGVKMEDL